MQTLLTDKEGFAAYRVPAVVYQTMEGSAAHAAGLQEGDSITAVNGMATPAFSDLRAALDAVLAGRPAPPDQVPSIGCNIKWKAGNAPDYFS